MSEFQVTTTVSLLIIVSLLFSCAPFGPPPDSGAKTVIRDVPFYPENRQWCGPASLAGVMNYWRDSVPPDTIAEATYSSAAGGTFLADLAWFARTHGYEAHIKASTVSELRRAIDRDQPVIVFVRRETFLGNYNHFMVVIGYTSNGFIVNSGLRSDQYLSNKTFLSYWNKNGNYALFVRPDRTNQPPS